MKKINTTYLIALSALVFASCSESNELSSGIPLSKEKIAFAANVVNGWNGNSHTRVQNGIAEYHGPLKMTSNTKQQLYLHPIIQNGIYFYNQEGELVTRDGIAISKGGNKIISTTRGSLAQDVNSGFGISAIYNDGTTDKAYFVNNKATKVGDLWFTENKTKWPASTNGLSFYAYAPYSNSNDNSMLRLADGDEIAQSKQIQYEASSTDIVNQPDFVVANSKDNKLVSGKAQPSVNLTFSHVLTAISFVAAKDILSGTVKSVSFKNVKGNGIYNLETGSWTSVDTPMDFTLRLGTDGNGVTVNGTSDIALTSGTQNFMMIPQRFTSDDSKVVMELEEADGTSYHLEAPLKTEWQAGHTVTYRLSSSSLLPGLEITTVSYPQDWVDKYKVNGKSVFNSAYKKGDAIGIYAINARGEVTQANVKATYDGTKWSLPGGEKLRNNTSIHYFAYFPYVTDDDQKIASMPKVGTKVSSDDLSSEHAFFKGLEDNWEVKDQSTLEKLNAADLQVCKAILDKTASGLNLTMQHGVGLADITLGQGLNYKLENYEEYKWTASIVSDKLADKESQLYKPVVNKMLGVIKANHDTTFKGVASGGWKCAWKNELTFNPTCAQIIKKTAEREDDNEHLYTLEVGDIYYTNGALTHQDYDLETIQPIGIVGYLGNDYWTEKGVSGKGGHALVMCLRNVDSAGSTQEALDDYDQNGFNGTKVKNYIGKTFQFLTYRTPSVRPCINSKEDIVNSCNNAKGSGYTETNALITTYHENAPAAFYAKNYTTLYPTSDLCTGWFLPSAGQYYAVMSNLGAPFSEDWSGIAFGANEGYFKNMTQITSNINEKMKIVGDFNYTEFFGRIAKSAWTSSENSNRYDCNAIGLFSRETTLEGAIRFVSYMGNGYGWNTDQYFHIRPFLAF